MFSLWSFTVGYTAGMLFGMYAGICIYGLAMIKWVTIPACIIGLVLCWVWGRKGR